jgi:hypothetical protein
MTARDSEIDALDPRFPIRLTMPESIFWDATHLEPYRPCIESLAWRARHQAAQHQERFITPQPRFVPEAHHDPDDTRTDWPWAGGDTFPREGQVRPEDTDTFLVVHAEAERREAVLCTCGHEKDAHQHYRRGTPCALCGCARWRPRRWWRVLGHHPAIEGDR